MVLFRPDLENLSEEELREALACMSDEEDSE